MASPTATASAAPVQPRSKNLPPTYFVPSTPRSYSSDTGPSSDNKNPDERTLALGRTIRIIQERMPTLLHGPLPTEILSPAISLHLFPSTHPHLPVVRGRVAYIAALWTTPVAWGRLPGGHTTLEVVSARMLESERLRIRWRAGARDGGRPEGGIRQGTTEVHDGEFSGIFIFEFDDKGRVAKHIIENSEEDDGERLPGVISVTEWLLRKARGVPAEPGIAQGGALSWQYQRPGK